MTCRNAFTFENGYFRSNASHLYFIYHTRDSKRNRQLSFRAFNLTIFNVLQFERNLSDA